jgi:hypothetical protein
LNPYLKLTEEEQAQFDKLALRADKEFDKIVAYLAARAGCDDVAALPQKKIEHLKAEARGLAEAWHVVHVEEELDDGSDDHVEDAEDEQDEDDELLDDEQDDGNDGLDEGDESWDPEAAEDKLANLHRYLLKLLAHHHRALQVAHGVVRRAVMRRQGG